MGKIKEPARHPRNARPHAGLAQHAGFAGHVPWRRAHWVQYVLSSTRPRYDAIEYSNVDVAPMCRSAFGRYRQLVALSYCASSPRRASIVPPTPPALLSTAGLCSLAMRSARDGLSARAAEGRQTTRPVQDIKADVRLSRALWLLADGLGQLKASSGTGVAGIASPTEVITDPQQGPFAEVKAVSCDRRAASKRHVAFQDLAKTFREKRSEL